MKIIIRLVGGLLALLFVTAMTVAAGMGGFFFAIGLFVVIFYAFAG